jgi:hypothetical protein
LTVVNDITAAAAAAASSSPSPSFTLVETLSMLDGEERPIFGAPKGKYDVYCDLIDRNVWNGCQRSRKRACGPRSTVLVQHKCAFLNENSGTVFDSSSQYIYQPFVTPVSTTVNPAKVEQISPRAAAVVYPSIDPESAAYFLHVIPRVIWLFGHLPSDVKIIVPFSSKFLLPLIEAKILPEERLIRFLPNTLYYSDNIFVLHE